MENRWREAYYFELLCKFIMVTLFPYLFLSESYSLTPKYILYVDNKNYGYFWLVNVRDVNDTKKDKIDLTSLNY